MYIYIGFFISHFLNLAHMQLPVAEDYRKGFFLSL